MRQYFGDEGCGKRKEILLVFDVIILHKNIEMICFTWYTEIIEYSYPPIEIQISEGLAQVIHSDRTITEAIKARIIINRKAGKIRSAIPID